jgi:glutathione S-transferase
MLRLYDYLPSGNGYKVRLLLAKLGIPFALIERDIDRGETRTPDFLARNPNGRIPLLELDDGTHLAESNAILCYLADGTPYLPAERLARAQVLQWLFFEQYSHEPNIATLRYWLHHPVDMSGWRAHARAPKFEAGGAALGVMETHLAERDFFVGQRLSIADIALYAYTHVAEEGGFTLQPFPAVRAWLDRVASDRPHVTIADRP